MTEPTEFRSRLLTLFHFYFALPASITFNDMIRVYYQHFPVTTTKCLLYSRELWSAVKKGPNEIKWNGVKEAFKTHH